MNCRDAEHLIARDADTAALTGEARAGLDAHLKSCVGCRAALDEQRRVAQLLRARSETPVRPGFAQRLAARLDEKDEPSESILDLANWRAWAVGLTPLAAALVLMAYLGIGAGRTDSTAISSSESSVASFEAATTVSASGTPAAVFLTPSASGDLLLESVLTGAPPSTGENTDVR